MNAMWHELEERVAQVASDHERLSSSDSRDNALALRDFFLRSEHDPDVRRAKDLVKQVADKNGTFCESLGIVAQIALGTAAANEYLSSWLFISEQLPDDCVIFGDTGE